MKRLITTDPSAAEKLIAKIRELRENLKVRKDPAAKAQLELVRKAEKLFLQGLSEVGGTIDAMGKIHLAHREEDENTAEDVDENRKVRYNRNVPQGNDFVTQAMIWARSDGTEIGEEKAFTNGDDVVVISKTKEGYEEIGYYPNQNTDNIDHIYEKARDNNEQLYGSLYSSISAYEAIPGGSSLHSGGNVGTAGIHGQNGGIHQSQSRSNGVGSSQGSQQNYSRVKPVHYHFNDDGSTQITYSDGRTVTEPTKVRRSRKQTGEAVSISKEEMELLRANYTVDDMPTWAKGVYNMDEVTAKDL